MYYNIGGKIKGLAKFFAIVGMIFSVIIGVAAMASTRYAGGDVLIVGILIITVGSLISWVSSWLLYGFGELIENSAKIEMNTRKGGGSIVKKEIDWEQIRREEADKIKCPQCGHEQKGNRTVCFECGAMLRKPEASHHESNETYNIKCPSCGCVQFKGNKFCKKCGTSFVQ